MLRHAYSGKRMVGKVRTLPWFRTPALGKTSTTKSRLERQVHTDPWIRGPSIGETCSKKLGLVRQVHKDPRIRSPLGQTLNKMEAGKAGSDNSVVPSSCHGTGIDTLVAGEAGISPFRTTVLSCTVLLLYCTVGQDS